MESFAAGGMHAPKIWESAFAGIIMIRGLASAYRQKVLGDIDCLFVPGCLNYLLLVEAGTEGLHFRQCKICPYAPDEAFPDVQQLRGVEDNEKAPWCTCLN